MGPRVSVLVLNCNGQFHLADCFESLSALEDPGVSFELVLVDNGSSDDSCAFVARRFPGVRIIRHPENLQFCAGYNRAVEQAGSEYVAFLNNDTRVDPGWLRALLATIRGEKRCRCAASKILDWDGEHIDFVGVLPAWNGHSWQLDHGSPDIDRHDRERRLLFACGGSMLIHRQTFLDVGGFDEAYQAYFEDVDLGWRLNVLGHDVVFSPDAVTYHRLHGFWGEVPHPLKLPLYERNALYTIYKNYDEANLRRILPAAILLLAKRAWAHAGIDPSSYRIGGPPAPTAAETIPAEALSYLVACDEFTRGLAQAAEKRRWIQARRKRPDREVLRLFEQPFLHHELGEDYSRAFDGLVSGFGLDRIFAANGLAP